MAALLKSTDIACFMSSPGFTSKNRSFEAAAGEAGRGPLEAVFLDAPF